MKILAIDPGYERVVIAILEKHRNTENLLYSDCLITSSKDEFPNRLLVIGNEIEKVIKKYKPEALAIETLFFNTNQKTVMRVSEARGAIIYKAKAMDIEVYEYTPLQIKIAVVGYGRATKEQVTDMVPKLISMDTTAKRKDDEFDAIAIGLTHCAHKKL